ncbi:uncharacterized protein LOC126984254 isoform X2 [Eriocheir sinensis]|nr:uncharacterized protein LOC126984254 isoform X2 [Eriocheir sinensis]XP_050693977.1 uncharacterized protein LOC126984254 isoform X2 [Eriocheir sinensis]XP_050694009.1 uncharacterized protein LOC126984254 isoform X2 [Eriocheir sinensis]XP_050694105.1 uncharacterized protein LOC126984254 isoform X2 [Eriocheir sinensis]
MKEPKTGKEISKKWAEHILKEHRAATNPPALLRVDTCTVDKDKGDGYNSEVFFFTVETTEQEESSSPETKKVYHLVGKFLSQEPHSQVMNKKLKSHLKEYLVYTELIPAMNNMLNEKAPEEPKISYPELIYGKCKGQDFVLVMENLQYAGCEMNDKRKGLDDEHLKAAVDQIARVHALSYVLCQTADVSKYSCFPSVGEHISIFIAMMGVMVDNCVRFLTSFEKTQELGNKLKSCQSILLEKLSASVVDDFPIKCLVHGDFWNNNFMFKYAAASDEQKIIEEVKLIDWGNASWGPPVFDLQYLVHTSTTRTTRKDHLDEVLSQYHETFMRLTTHLGHPPANWSIEQLKSEWNKTYSYGFLVGCTLTQGTLSTTNPANKKNEPSVLDKPMLFPIKFVVDGMTMGAAKLLSPLLLSGGGKKFIVSFMKKIMKPILEELKSGKNEAMNTRLLDLVYEADEKGLLTT